MRALGPRNRRRGRSICSGESRFHLEVQVLAMQTDTRSPLVPSAPVSPEQRSQSHWQRMEQDTHLTRFGRGASVPLALLAQRTRTTVTNAGPIYHAQAPIGFSAVFMRQECAPSRTPQGPIGL